MNIAPTREEKLASFQQSTKLPSIKTAHQLAAASSNKARILIDHPHSYRDWTIVCKDSVPGFYHQARQKRSNQMKFASS